MAQDNSKSRPKAAENSHDDTAAMASAFFGTPGTAAAVGRIFGTDAAQDNDNLPDPPAGAK